MPGSLLSLPKIEFNLHLGRDPKHRNSEFFLRGVLSGADRDLPGFVHRIKQHGHFRRPGTKGRCPVLNERREFIRRSPLPSHIGFHQRDPNISLQNLRRVYLDASGEPLGPGLRVAFP